MHKSSFSMQRIRLLLRQEWAELGRRYLFVFLGLGVILLLYMLYEQKEMFIDLTNMQQNENKEILAFNIFYAYLGVFPTWLNLSLSVTISLAFVSLQRENTGSLYLMLPASTLEKWVSKIITNFFFIPPILIVVYLLMANIHLVILSSSGYSIRWISPADLMDNFSIPGFSFGSIFTFSPGFSFGIILVFYFLLVAIWQPRFSWIKSMLGLLIPTLLVIFFYYPLTILINGLPSDYRTEYPVVLKYPKHIWDLSLTEAAWISSSYSLGIILFALGCFLASYFALREKQV